ncbi:MAG TPA: MFS transporter [Gaiellaceae bacterium]
MSDTLARTFASIRNHRNYRLYFAGQAVSFTGSWMQQIAASWLLLQLTDSPIAVGALALIQLLPVTVFGLFVGTLLDRYEVRRVAITTETTSLVLAATLGALTLADVVTVWEIYVFAALLGMAQAVGGPARHALVFEMVGADDLANAVGLNSSLGTTARVLGPAIGGIVVASAGAGVAFEVNAASFLAEVASLVLLDRALLHRHKRGSGSSVLGGALEALRFVVHTPRAAVAFFAVLMLSTFSFNFNVLLPLVARRTLHAGPGTFGLIAAVFGVGALIGATMNAARGYASLRILLIGGLGYGAFELALAPLGSLIPICIVLFSIGVFYTQWGTTALATIQLEAPEHLRGRAASFYFFAFLGGAPLGGLFASWLVRVGGTELAFYFAGVVAVVTALAGAARLAMTSAARPISSSLINR